MNAYVDSSVILRRVLGQPDALPRWGEVTRGVTSELTRVECLRTIDRLRVRFGFDAALVTERFDVLDRELMGLALVDLEREVLHRAAQPLPQPLGTLDALHLASALLWRERNGPVEVFATHDAELGRAARAAGFSLLGV